MEKLDETLGILAAAVEQSKRIIADMLDVLEISSEKQETTLQPILTRMREFLDENKIGMNVGELFNALRDVASDTGISVYVPGKKARQDLYGVVESAEESGMDDRFHIFIRPIEEAD